MTRSVCLCHFDITLPFSRPSVPGFHLLCDDSTPDGCQRCKPKVSRLCCDLCNPAAFTDLTTATVSSKSARAPAKSHIKAYDMANADWNLKQTLLDWRKEK